MRSLMLFVLMFLSTYIASAQPNSQLIGEQLSIYREAYPKIEFVLLNSTEDFDQLTPLTGSLGKDLSNVDYEHPDGLRVTLVEAQEYRIALQLEHGNGTATLFKTPNSQISNKPYTCLITLGLPLHEGDLAATRFIYDISDEALKSLPESYHLDNQDFMAYSVDHEIFHCIDAFTNGYLYPRTKDLIKPHYDRARAELRSEIFSAIAHLSRQPNGKRFLKSLAIARTVNLLSGDVEHYTSDALNNLAESSEQKTRTNMRALAKESMRLADDHVLSYAEYKQFIVTLWSVLQEYGIDTGFLFSEYPELALENSSPEQIKAMRNTINAALSVIH